MSVSLCKWWCLRQQPGWVVYVAVQHGLNCKENDDAFCSFCCAAAIISELQLKKYA
jgi:hypothetical protein